SVAQYQQYQLVEARKSISEALRLNPYNAQYYGHLADLEIQALNWRAAVDAAEQGLSIDPRHVECLNTRAQALVVLNRFAEAEDGLDEALRLEPENSYTHANKGWISLRRGNIEQSIDFFKESLRLNPNNTWAKQGVVESLKSRNKLYHRVLIWTIRAGEVGGHWRAWIILSSLIFPPIRLFLVFYAVFLGLTNVMFDLMLRLDPYGRRILTPEEKRRNNGSLVLFAVIIGLFGFTMYTHDHLVGQTLAEVKRTRVLLVGNRFDEAAEAQRGLIKRVSGMISAERFDQARLLLRELRQEIQEYRKIPGEIKLQVLLLSADLEDTYESELTDFAEAEKIATGIGDKGSIFQCVAGEAKNYIHLKKYDEALAAFERGNELLKSLDAQSKRTEQVISFLEGYERLLRNLNQTVRADQIKAERDSLE
ncbi:MAG: tetratricopeptide repeat protein, partial [Cyanobacteria bacterium]|nr:tetratricopeptide repeat protein [Cyanobacteriota bacterium]